MLCWFFHGQPHQGDGGSIVAVVVPEGSMLDMMLRVTTRNASRHLFVYLAIVRGVSQDEGDEPGGASLPPGE